MCLRNTCEILCVFVNTPSVRKHSTPMSNAQTDMIYPASSHMRLGRGLSNIINKRHCSCYDMESGTAMDLEPAVKSLSESDLFSLFESANNGSISENQPKNSKQELKSSVQNMETS